MPSLLDGAGRGCAALLRDPIGSLSQPACPSLHSGPAAVSGPSDQAPACPLHPGTHLCAPQDGQCPLFCSPHWRPPRQVTEESGLGLTQCVSLVYSLGFSDYIPAFLQPASEPHCQAGHHCKDGTGPPRGDPWQEEEERPCWCPPWLAGAGGPAQWAPGPSLRPFLQAEDTDQEESAFFLAFGYVTAL